MLKIFKKKTDDKTDDKKPAEETPKPVVKIETKKLNANDARRGLRVQVNDHEEYQGKLGTISEIKDGCSCSDGWCKVKLDLRDDNKRPLTSEFRYGHRGDISDLLEVIKEPEREIIKEILVTPETAKKGAKVMISENSKYYGQHDDDGVIVDIDNEEEGFAEVRFSSGYRNYYRYGNPELNAGASDLVLIEESKIEEPKEPTEDQKNAKEGDLVTPKTARVGLKVKISTQSEYAYQSKKVGKIVKFHADEKGWVEVKFPDHKDNYRIGDPDIDDGTSDLVIA
jgi:hypothetical protein